MIVNLGGTLAVIAKLQKKTQSQIANECAVSRTTINRFFGGHTEVRATDLVNILKSLGIDLEPQLQAKIAVTQ
jgi:transcriptional regulator with XRE-family HTH domain